MALDSFEPNKGAFVSWLKGYINGKRNKSLPGSKQNKKDDAPLYNREIPISRLDNDDSRFDSHRQPWDEGSEETHGFGKDMLRAKSLIGEERFELVRKRVILGMTYDEISAETDLTIPVIKKKLSRAYDALRTATALNINSGALLTHMEDGSIFLTIKQLALRLDKKEEQIYKEAKGIYRTQYRINPLHILKIGKEMRFRYKLSPKGLEYPEFIFQGNKNPKYMSKVARKQRDK
jgi:DNA-directed RNA polymerase specialized sigma24 family protein